MPAEVAQLLVHSRVKKILKARARDWGGRADRERLPAHIIPALLADFDKLITRYAAQI